MNVLLVTCQEVAELDLSSLSSASDASLKPSVLLQIVLSFNLEFLSWNYIFHLTRA